MIDAKKSIVLILAGLLFLVIPGGRAEASGPDNFANCRLGVGGVSNVSGYDIEQLNMGLYLDWQTSPPTGLPAGVEYIRTVRVHQVKECGAHCIGAYTRPYTYTVSPDLSTLANRVRSAPGSTWRIGNEIERRDWSGGGQDEITPELYATAFHQIRQVIKAADPSARIAMGSVILASPLRLAYLDRVWNSYQSQYGYSMGRDIDVWVIHGFLLREVRNSWGAEIPAGFDNEDANPNNNYDPLAGFLYGADYSAVMKAHHDLAYFQEFIRAMRRWMANHGERHKPLLIGEYGVLYTQEYGISPAQVKSYLTGSFDYLLTASDPAIGFPADENRLVQSWIWYSLNDMAWNGPLFDPGTTRLSEFGATWKNYVADPARPLASQPRLNLLAANLRTEPAVASEAQIPATFILKADIANSGNRATTTGHNIRVSFWDGDPNKPGSSRIGDVQILKDIAGCGRFTTVAVEWPNRPRGAHTWYVKVEPVAGETNAGDNLASATALVASSIIYLPLVRTR